ncbi:hypothetical protein HIM_01629 [Hirsutella minnesotensis 3608]|nr:hypothetical protein HIM_01629 [Hirsutella minnesotensis 3608]
MSNWREVGEVPDSEEDEDGFDSDESDAADLRPAVNSAVITSEPDVWDFPDSQEPQLPQLEPRIDTEAQATLSTFDFNLFDSSPLSSPLSERELPVSPGFALDRNIDNLPGSYELGRIAHSTPRKPTSSEANQKTDALPSPGPVQEVPHEDVQDIQLQDERQAAIRYERSLRPRKPIQEHPYLLESVHYSTILRRHGVKPVRAAIEAPRTGREDTAADDDFQEISQDSTQRPGPQDGGSRLVVQIRGGLRDYDFPSSSPLQISPSNHLARVSSQVSSRAETDDTSVPDQDLPALEELLSRPPRLISNKTAKPKRRATPPPSTIRKRRKLHIIDNDPPEIDAPSRATVLSADAAQTPSHHSPRHHRGSQSPVSRTRRSPSPGIRNNSPSPDPLLSTPQLPGAIIDIPSDVESIIQQKPKFSEDQELISLDIESESDAESDVDVVDILKQRIRGVLPASWLRLDQQSARDKAQKNAKQQRRPRSADKDNRRGVAQRRQALPGTSTDLLFLDESSDDGEVAARVNAAATQQLNQTILSVDRASPPAASSHELPDDDDSVIEDDHIDLMQSGHPSKKRQFKLPESVRAGQKRKMTGKNSSSRQRKPSKQPKITDRFSRTDESMPEVNTRFIKKKYIERLSSSVYRNVKDARRAPSANPPQLSILDIIEPEAPAFLKIAARTARKRKNKGRSSPRRKTIQLATRQDHIDAVSVLNRWRAGSIPQRSSVTAARTVSRRQSKAQPLGEGSGNKPVVRRRKAQKPLGSTSRKVFEHVKDGGSVSFRPLQGSETPPLKPGREMQSSRVQSSTVTTRPASNMRPAQLESEQIEQMNSTSFLLRKRLLDRLYHDQRRLLHQNSSSAPSALESSALLDLGEHRNDGETPSEPPLRRNGKRLPRKQSRPKRLNPLAPQYSHANDPLPEHYSPEPENIQKNSLHSKLLGLGPYGTSYTHHFEVFPLEPGVYFHESTLLGSGIIPYCSSYDISDKRSVSPRASFNLDGKFLNWGSFDSHVSSELGIVLDFIAEQMDPGNIVEGGAAKSSLAVDAATFVLKYFQNSLILCDEAQYKSFVTRAIECLSSFSERAGSWIEATSQNSTARQELLLKIGDRLLLSTLVALEICRSQPLLVTEQLQLEDCLKKLANISLALLSNFNADHLRNVYQEACLPRNMERGLRSDNTVLHSWVVLMKSLEVARIPRASFWDLAQTIIIPSHVISSSDARDFENAWEFMFSLLPLTDFNNMGIVNAGWRHIPANDGWIIPQKLLKRVFQLYQENSGQAPSFNDYCRALLGRCHYLIRQWGWARSAALIGLIFDFFGSQHLEHLRNEEVHDSPRFLESLVRRPTLDIEPSDRCFHIFLKLIALSIEKLRQIGAMKDVRNLVARTIPNHNRQHLQDQQVLTRELAALRNHHDLLATLFWASPSEVQPAVSLVERLVVPASSHKEACLINIRCWSQLARFVIASGQAAKSFKPFMIWRNSFFQQVLQQFDSVASDVQQQALSLARETGNPVSEDRINQTIAANREAVMDVVYASIAASLDVMRHSADLEAATFALNTSQLQSIFKQFSVAPPLLDWGILRAALATLDSFIGKIDEFKEAEESQQSESQILNAAQADDALLLIDEEISRNFFSMARCVLSSRKDQSKSAVTALGKSSCIEQIVTLSARIGARFINGGTIRLSDMFKAGKYGLFDGKPCRLGLDQRRDLILFLGTLLKYGSDFFDEDGFSLLDIWASSLVKPREYLRYEMQFAHELLRQGKSFVPDTVQGLSVQPDYNTNRDLFEFTISSMRRSLREAGPSLQKVLQTESARTLRIVMDQIKIDLATMCREARGHAAYVTFIQGIIGLIKTHGSDICAVDDFFLQINREYCPSASDPNLQVAGLISYGLRLKEGDSRSSHQLFFLLLHNAKFAMLNDKLKDEVMLLRKGMSHGGVTSFILGKMLPAIIQTCFREPAAFPLLDLYAEALHRVFAKRTAPREIGEDDLPSITTLARATVEGLRKAQQDDAATCTGAQLHVIRQALAVLNMFCPSLFAMSATTTSREWSELVSVLHRISEFASTAEVYMDHLLESEETLVHTSRLYPSVENADHPRTRLDAEVQGFADSIMQDIQRNWSVTTRGILIQTPGNRKWETDVTAGLEMPQWDMRRMLEDVRDGIREWRWWQTRISGNDGLVEQLESVIL